MVLLAEQIEAERDALAHQIRLQKPISKPLAHGRYRIDAHARISSATKHVRRLKLHPGCCPLSNSRPRSQTHGRLFDDIDVDHDAVGREWGSS